MPSPQVMCHKCTCVVDVKDRRYRTHTDLIDGGECLMVGRVVPPEGLTPESMEYLARKVLPDLVGVLRDEDPWVARVYLTSMPVAILQMLCTVAIAAVDVEQPITSLLDWVRPFDRGDIA